MKPCFFQPQLSCTAAAVLISWAESPPRCLVNSRAAAFPFHCERGGVTSRQRDLSAQEALLGRHQQSDQKRGVRSGRGFKTAPRDDRKDPSESLEYSAGAMKAGCWMLAAVWLLGGVCQGTGMSTCKPLDLEMVKRKRIEAIRGQILSKLRLAKEPEPGQEGEGNDIPLALVSIYNSTVEFSREQAQKAQAVPVQDAEEEEYFAKEVHKFDMKRGEYRRTPKEKDTRW
ncbi:TGF beta-1-like [Arapaima gigas]